MKLPSLCLLTTATLFSLGSPAAQKDSPVPLRYDLSPGQTNAYAVEMEVQGESGREIIGGNLIVASRSAGQKLFSITLRGRLNPKIVPGMMPPFYRPGGPPQLSSLFMGGMPFEARELVIDEHGEIVRQAGDLALPIPLGQLLASLFPALPRESARDWSAEDTVFVLDEPLLQGPALVFQAGNYPYTGYYPGRGPQAVLAARQKTTYKVTDSTPETVTLKKTFALDSVLLTGQEPRISASGEGQIVLDRTSGWPRKLDLQCKSVVLTENLSRRCTLALRWTMLEGAQKQAVLAPPPAKPAEVPILGGPDLDKLVTRLNSPDNSAREAAARELSAARLEEVPPRVLFALSGFAADNNDTVRRAALTVLAAKGGKEQVPVLLKALNESDQTTRAAVIKGLGRLKDPRAAEPLAQIIASGQPDQFYHPRSDFPATEALIRLGPSAEAAALGLLKEKHIDTLFQACTVLKQVGSKKSLGPLKELITYPNKELSEAAADACRSIQARVSP